MRILKQLSSATIVVLLFPIAAQGEEFRFSNENWFTTAHPEVASFNVLPDGAAYGTTTNNIPFTLTNVPNDTGLRVQKFEIQDHFHYLIAGNVVYTLPELSVALGAAYGQ